ncbi:hypothetical protein [Prosthecomicrobium pneumaticum]|uniref:Antifreeze protein n=1 Tax=Prosthecomicrobium pneumaticum TaxID=81895 RepID=A0A7W9CV66_9HYPH|nr:hypothetical protein [Prosthecomicrobium pneumaticum]MBB5752299.1 hypothetical protein [Prosthecomicrobium pneumaticum]
MNPFLSLGLEQMRLALAAQEVIAHRLAALASPGAFATAEYEKMIVEKMFAPAEAMAAVIAASVKGPLSVVETSRVVTGAYGKRIRANRRRLRRRARSAA